MKLIFGIIFILISLGITAGFFKQEWDAVQSAFNDRIKKHIIEGFAGFLVFQALCVILFKSWNVSVIPLLIVLFLSFCKEGIDKIQGFGFEFLDVKIRLIGALYGLIIYGVILQVIRWIRVLL